MAHEATIRRMFDEIINRGRVELVDELFDPDFTSQTPQGPLDREGFKDYVRTWRAGFPDVRCEVSDVVEHGDRIAWAVTASGTHTGEFMGIPATGRSVRFDSLNIATMRDGRGWRHQVVMDTLALMVQLGVVSPPVPAPDPTSRRVRVAPGATPSSRPARPSRSAGPTG
jgi:predicted ester cyclase